MRDVADLPPVGGAVHGDPVTVGWNGRERRESGHPTGRRVGGEDRSPWSAAGPPGTGCKEDVGMAHSFGFVAFRRAATSRRASADSGRKVDAG